MGTHAFHPSTQETETGRSERRDSQGYTENPCLKKLKKEKRKRKNYLIFMRRCLHAPQRTRGNQETTLVVSSLLQPCGSWLIAWLSDNCLYLQSHFTCPQVNFPTL